MFFPSSFCTSHQYLTKAGLCLMSICFTSCFSFNGKYPEDNQNSDSAHEYAFEFVYDCNTSGLPKHDFVYEEAEDCSSDEGIPYYPPIQPNIMLVIDRSHSMNDIIPCDERPCSSKWEQLLALSPYLDGVEQSSNLGLTLFPGEESCDAVIAQPISSEDDADEQIMQVLSSTEPNGQTPISYALDLVGAQSQLQDPYRDNVVVLLTDGVPSCTETTIEAVECLVNREIPVQLHVIGFGSGTVSDTASSILQDIATAAEITTGPDNYFQANTIEDLLLRLDDIAASLEPCQFVMGERISADELVVSINGEEIAPCDSEDCVEGYFYDEETGVVLLARATCHTLGGEECPDILFHHR